jgi:hypothetical protein
MEEGYVFGSCGDFYSFEHRHSNSPRDGCFSLGFVIKSKTRYGLISHANTADPTSVNFTKVPVPALVQPQPAAYDGAICTV